MRQAARAALICSLLAAASNASDPRAAYLIHCGGCHGLRGEGRVGNQVPAFRSTSQLLSTPAGREYVVRVPGVAQARLDDADVAKLLNWIFLELAGERPDHFVAFAAGEVSSLRRSPLSAPRAVRGGLAPAIALRRF